MTSQCDSNLVQAKVVCNPIRTYTELLEWDQTTTPWANTVISLQQRSKHSLRGSKQICHDLMSLWRQPFRFERNSVPKTIFCHDLKGGYLEDRFVNGSAKHDEYRFFHWGCIDIFVYFSHQLVTIPPPAWINAGHLHGVKVLGTLITEWDDGKAIWDKVFESDSSLETFVNRLVTICLHFGFDGYLLNVENKLDPCQVGKMEKFVKLLHNKLHERVAIAELIWYDSVTIEGKLKWQNELNNLNRAFFDNCDGIFLNYTWSEKSLDTSAMNAGVRMLDVYVGVDIFGRNCYSGGGFNTWQAVKLVQEYNLSLALFAPGWVHETLNQTHFICLEYIFWKKLWRFLHIHGPAQLPFTTSFCQGYGKRLYHNGKVVQDTPWYNLSKQQYQPSVPSCLNDCCIERKDKPKEISSDQPEESAEDASSQSIEPAPSSSTTADCSASNEALCDINKGYVQCYDKEKLEPHTTTGDTSDQCVGPGPTSSTTADCSSSNEASCDEINKGCVQHYDKDAFLGGGCLEIQRLRLLGAAEDLYFHRLLMCDFTCNGRVVFSVATKNNDEENTDVDMMLLIEEDSGKYSMRILLADATCGSSLLEDYKVYPLQASEVSKFYNQVAAVPQYHELNGNGNGDGHSWKMRHYMLNIKGRILEIGTMLSGPGNSVLLGFLGIFPITT